MSNFSNIPPFGDDPAVRQAAAIAWEETLHGKRKTSTQWERLEKEIKEILGEKFDYVPNIIDTIRRVVLVGRLDGNMASIIREGVDGMRQYNDLGMFKKKDGTHIPANPITAWDHYVGGSGEELEFSFDYVYPEIAKQGIKVCHFADFFAVLRQGLGKYEVELLYGISTSGDGWLLLGRVVLKFEGIITVEKDRWIADGVYKCYDDKYDFDFSLSRHFGNLPVMIAWLADGKDYDIEIRGQKPVRESGKITNFERRKANTTQFIRLEKKTIIRRIR